ncbi:hemolysin III [Dongia mobilis]|uniref:Hemolysin III n=2 Tax=Dongia mobilis TaxID=578943 RepID=A0A4R6WWG2_9PROT|nr:hemolysin III [Dongia mobilis]
MPRMPIGRARQVNRALLTATLGLGVVALLSILQLAATPHATAGHLAAIVFAISLLICSLFSFLYNMYETSRFRPFLRYCDHGAIFLLIAGTYTPFVIQGVLGPFGIDLLVWVWALALVGIALKVVLRCRYDRAFVGLYLLLGWLFLFSIEPFVDLNPLVALVFLAVGGLAYTVGAVIYGRHIGNWTDPVWHGCVLAGSGSHYVAVLSLMG